MVLQTGGDFLLTLFRSKDISFRSSGFWSILAIFSPQISPERQILLTVQSHSEKPILQKQFCPTPTTPIAPCGDIQEAIASLCQTKQTYWGTLSCLHLLGVFPRWHPAADLETLLLTPLIRRGALQHAQSGLSSPGTGCTPGPHAQTAKFSLPALQNYWQYYPMSLAKTTVVKAWPSICKFSSPSWCCPDC